MDALFSDLHCVLGRTFSWTRPFSHWSSNSHRFPSSITCFCLRKV